MVRRFWSASWATASFPHSRGDGPKKPAAAEQASAFSPLAWGWSGERPVAQRFGLVFPTRVGMVQHICLEHRLQIVFSPLAWGWSAFSSASYIGSGVFPTRVGMVREKQQRENGKNCFPHSRGDGPSRPCNQSPRSPFSPLAWGWSAKIII